MEAERNPFVYVLVAVAVIGFILGVWVGIMPFDLDTYDCTVKCQMGHSVQWIDKCFCEAK